MPHKLSFSWKTLWYAAICAPMLFLVLECLRGAYCDFAMIRNVTLNSEMSRLRSQAVRRAGNLDVLLEEFPEPLDWQAARKDPHVEAFWKQVSSSEHPQLYGAVLDRSRTVVMHTDPEYINTQLLHGWYERKVAEAGDDVVHFVEGGLAGVPTYDVSVPLYLHGKQIGDYHSGLDAGWLDTNLWPQQRDMLLRWGIILAAALLVDAIALWSLIFVTRRNWHLLNLVQRGIQEQARILAQIGGGLAHQIRNPLHALRINLHILKRSQHGQARLSPEQLEATFRESDAEIDVLDRLMRDLLQFAVPDSGTRTEVEIGPAITAAVNLFDEEFRRKQIEVTVDLPQEPLSVVIDPNHLRQSIGNLLLFTHLNTPSKGQVDVTLARRGKRAELTVGHSGPALSKQQQQQIFEPFQSPRESGSGLELALVQCVVLDAGGTISCEKRAPSGNRFRVSLPLVELDSRESDS